MPDCRSCGAPIEWALTKKRRRIPLDPATPQLRGDENLEVLERLSSGISVVGTVPVGDGSRISHFATCPNSKRHRRRR